MFYRYPLKRILLFVAVIGLFAAIPLTVYISQKQQETLQHADSRDWQFPRDFSGALNFLNLNFENNFNNWSTPVWDPSNGTWGIDTTEKHTGSKSLKGTLGSGAWGVACFNQELNSPINPSEWNGNTYNFSYWYKTTANAGTFLKVNIFAGWWNSNWEPSNLNGPSSSTWTQVNKDITIPQGLQNLALNLCYSGSPNESVWFDDVQITAVTPTPVPTSTPTPTPIPTNTPTPTNVPTTIPTPTPTITLTPTPPLTSTPTPTVTPPTGNIMLNLSLILPHANTQTKTATVNLYDCNNSESIASGQLTKGSGSVYTGTVTMGNFQTCISHGNGQASDSYTIKVKVNHYLRKLVGGDAPQQHITPGGQLYQVPQTTLVSGDVTDTPADTNNAIDTYDYNMIISCWGNLATGSTCSGHKDDADLDDDGAVGPLDLQAYHEGRQGSQHGD